MTPDQSQQVIDATLGAVGHKAAVGGGVVAYLGALFNSQTVSLWGIFIAALGLVMQWYFNRRRDRREQAEHELRMKLRGDTLGDRP